MNEEYNDLIERFSELGKNRKKDEIKNELQEILTFLYEENNNQNGESVLLAHESMRKLNDEFITDDEFFNAIYAYLISIKESIGNLFFK